MDDKELANMIVTGFLKDIPVQVGKLRKFLDEGDVAGIHLQAHNIRGAAANVGAPALRKVAFKLEEMGKNGSLAEALGVLPRLETELERVKIAIEDKNWT